MADYSEVKSKYCDKCKNQKHCYKPCPLVNAALWDLKEVEEEILKICESEDINGKLREL